MSQNNDFLPAIQHQQNSLLSQKRTFGDFIDDFVRFLDVSEKSLKAYYAGVSSLLAYMEERGIAKPMREDIIAYREELKVHRKAATVRLYLAGVRRFFRWLESTGSYPDVTKDVKGPKLAVGHRKDSLTTVQARELLESRDRNELKGLRDYAILLLMLTTGLRDVEVSRAEIADIRPLGDESLLYVQGKGRDEKDACVKLAPAVEKSIRVWLASVGVTRGPIFFSLSNNGYGQNLTTRSISRIVKTSLREIGLNSDRLTAHSLRHTAATLNLMSGGTLEETQQMLRHSNIATTMIYLHHLKRAQNMSESRIASKLLSDE